MSMIMRCTILAVLLNTAVAIAGAPSLVPGMPAEVVSIRHDRLSTEEYTALADEWRAYLAEHPQAAVAHVQIARALRYAGAPAAEVAEHMDRALVLGPECPEALDAAASRYLGEWESDDAAGCYRLGLKAEHLAPEWADVHFTMHPLALALGKGDEADRHLAAILDEGGIPAPVLDYCYNMLIGAAPDAIIFTNGDNDTYGTMALQSARGIRPDVLVLNLSLISQPRIRETLLASLEAGDPLPAQQRADLYQDFIQNYARDREMYSVKFIKAVVAKGVAAKAAAGDLQRPIYLALTVHHSVTDALTCARRLEGMLWRLSPGEEADDEGDAGTDLARIWNLFTGPYRLESATDMSLPWATHRSVARIMDNYPAVLVRVAAAAGDANDLDTARAALRLGLEIASFHGREGTVAGILEYWQDLDPDNPELEAWLEKAKG